MLIKRLVIINDVLNEVAHGTIAATIGRDEVGDVEHLMTCVGWARAESDAQRAKRHVDSFSFIILVVFYE